MLEAPKAACLCPDPCHRLCPIDLCLRLRRALPSDASADRARGAPVALCRLQCMAYIQHALPNNIVIYPSREPCTRAWLVALV